MESAVVREITATLKKIPRTLPDTLCVELFRARRVFVWGVGRSGLVGRMFAMRLRHLGIESWCIGDTVCPPFSKGDLLVVVSKSGEKGLLMPPVQAAHTHNVRIVGISGSENALTKRSDLALVIPAAESKQFGGSLFEQTAFLLLETCVERYRSMRRISFDSMKHNHANWE